MAGSLKDLRSRFDAFVAECKATPGASYEATALEGLLGGLDLRIKEEGLKQDREQAAQSAARQTTEQVNEQNRPIDDSSTVGTTAP